MIWYLASPYSKYPAGIEQAYRDVCVEQARLIRAGLAVYCPIAHSHGAAIHGRIDPLDHSVWLPADKPFMERCDGMILLQMPSWEISVGMRHEMLAFQAAGKPVVRMHVGVVPPALLRTRLPEATERLPPDAIAPAGVPVYGAGGGSQVPRRAACP